jgi:hypothetical protein
VVGTPSATFRFSGGLSWHSYHSKYNCGIGNRRRFWSAAIDRRFSLLECGDSSPLFVMCDEQLDRVIARIRLLSIDQLHRVESFLTHLEYGDSS